MNEHKNSVESVNILPSSGGVFEVKLNDQLLFSKKEFGRFPNDNEVEELIKKNLV